MSLDKLNRQSISQLISEAVDNIGLLEDNYLFYQIYNSVHRKQLFDELPIYMPRLSSLLDIITDDVIVELLNNSNNIKDKIGELFVAAHIEEHYSLVALINKFIDRNDVNYIHYFYNLSLGNMEELKTIAANIIDGTHDRANIYIEDNFDPLELLRNGFIPNLIVVNEVDKILSAIKHNISPLIFKYWYKSDPIKALKKIRVWCVITKHTAESYSIKAESAGILFTYPELLYKSNRPVNNMSLFRTPYSLTGNKKNDYIIIGDKNYPIIFPTINGTYMINEQRLIPVTRYTKGDKF